MTSNSANDTNLINIPAKTPGTSDFLRCLMIYVTFPDDSLSGYGYTIWKNRFQTTNPKPINPYSGTNGHLIDSLVGNNSTPFMTRYHDYTISDYFCEMSMGQYDVIGDEITLTLPRDSRYYKDSLDLDYGKLNRYVLQYLDTTRSINWSRYDNWSKSGGSWIFGTPDSSAEMIIINYRTIPNNNGWFWDPGIGGLGRLDVGIPLILGGVKIGMHNGVTVLNLLHAVGRSEINIEHEYSHKLFGYYGIPHCEVDGFHINVGMMTRTTSNTSYIMTPMERSADLLDYIQINNVNQTGIYIDTLPDFTESGISYKIKAPGTTYDYFWIANHQKKSLYDGIARGGKNCYDINFGEIDPACPDGKGLFVYREGFGCYNNINESYDIISAEGKYNWENDRTVRVPRQNYHFALDTNLAIFNILGGSRYYGKDEYRKSVNFTQQFLADDICSNNPEDYSVAWENRGDNFDAFNIGYEEIFSPYSNPATGSCDSTLTGLTIALTEQNSTTGAIIVKIYYNNDAQALIDLPPSKPKYLRVVKDFFGADTGIYGGGDPGTFHPKITWDKNIEPDFYTTSYLSNPSEIQPMYELFRGYSTDCDVQPEYTLIASLPHTDTVYVDSSTVLYDPDHTTVAHCTSDFLTYSYKILAKDTRGNRSLKSERGLVSGYSMECSLEDDGQVSNNENENLNELPAEYSLRQNFPNPFNPVTNIQYELPSDNFVSIKVFDIMGREIITLVNEFKTAGRYSAGFNGANISSGIYYYKIEAGNFSLVRKMILLK